jgi:hypothetical protein
MVNLRLLLCALALPLLVSAACGRSDPDGSLDAVEVDAVARSVCFDTAEELRTVLDGSYLPTGTALLSVADVTDACFDTETELRDALDETYLSADTLILSSTDVEALCFNTELELRTLLNDDYLPASFVPVVAFDDLTGVPVDLADGDDDTTYTATAPLVVAGTDVSLDTTGCVDGDALGFAGGSFGCERPSVRPVDAEAVGAVAANTRPFEAIPILVKVEVASGVLAVIGDQVNVDIYDAANRAPRPLLIVDAWAVGTAPSTTPPNWHLRDGAAQITADVVAPNVGVVTRVTAFANQALRNIDVADTLTVRVTAVAAGDDATFTVYVLALPL